ncbi:unnamed protein product [Effrenium voratum]|nr:unnamed protein product [Effrenium voratum]
MLRAVLLPTFCWAALARGRQVWSLDEAWRFALEESRPRSCAGGTFPRSLPGRCPHLAKQGRPEDGGPGSAAACRAACCEDVSCNAWQWCGPNATCEAPNSCWKGLVDLANCSTAGQWQGEGDPSMRPKRPKVGQPCDHEQCQVHFNDSHWELLDVPHDFVVAGNFSPHADKSHGYLPYKVGWYRKRLCLNVEEMQGWLEFEGVMVRSQVWLNGEFLGDHFSGYTPRLLDISQVTLKSGCENLLAVRADATSPDGWWYDGGGIYRHVWLTSVAPVHIAPFGLYTPAVVVGKIDRTEGLEHADAEVRPTVELVNQHNTSRNVRVECSISDGGKFVTSKDFDTSLAAGASLDLALPHMPLPGALAIEGPI